MLMKIAPVVLGASLSVCPFGGEVPGGYARIAGTVRMENGPAYRGSVFIACGESGLQRNTDSLGRYAVEYTVGPVPPGGGEPLPNGDFVLECRVNAPADRPPFAVRFVPATFTRERGARVTTVIDLVEGEIEEPSSDAAP